MTLSVIALLATVDSRAATETLEVSFTASASTGTFWPDYVVAVWLEDTGGDYVKTLVRWGNVYPHDLLNWTAASELDADAVTGATRITVGPHYTGQIDITMLPDRTYKIRIESTDENDPSSGQTNVATYTFDKNGTAGTQNPPAQGGFSNVQIDYSGRPSTGYRPGVYAGLDVSFNPPGALSLSGLATDDVAVTSTTWSKVSGPGSALFADAAALSTTATFTLSGVYVLGLTAGDGAMQTTDEMTVLVNTVDLTTVADAEVSSATPGQAWPNTDFRIRVWKQTDAEKEREGFVKFGLSAVPGGVETALLRLSVNDYWPLTGGDLTCDVQGVADGWTEGGITWDNSRSLTGAQLATFQGNNPLWTELDVTAFVSAEYDSDQYASFRALHRNVHNTSGFRINSREKNVKPTLRVTYRAPSVTVTSPSSSLVANSGETVTFACTATDLDAAPVSYSWSSNISGVIGTTDSFARGDLSDGNHTVSLTVADSTPAQAQGSVSFTVGSFPPTAAITSPANASEFMEGDTVAFAGTGTDPNTSDTVTLDWNSSLDGPLGSAASFSLDTLQPGSHTVTLTASDGSLSGAASVVIVVIADTDRDDLPDDWENLYAELDFDNPDSDGDSIPDGDDDIDDDGYTNREEYLNGTDPTVANTGGGTSSGGGCLAGAGCMLGFLALSGAALILVRRRALRS